MKAPVRDVTRVLEMDGQRGAKLLVCILSCGCMTTRRAGSPPPKQLPCTPCFVLGREVEMGTATEYVVWVDKVETEDDGRKYIADDPRNAAKQAAAHDHSAREGYLWSWPVDYIVKNLTSGKCYRTNVERETVPEFWTGKAVEIKQP